MSSPRAPAVLPQATPWRTDVEWQQDREPVMSVVQESDVPALMERLRRLGVHAPGNGRAALEKALALPDLPARLVAPQRGTGSLALALVAQHPAGMDADHLAFELGLLLNDDKRAAESGVASLAGTGVVVLTGGRRGERWRVLPPLRVALAQLTAPWLDSLDRRGGAPGVGERLGMRIKTSPAHAMALLLATLAASPPRLRSTALATELHAKDSARVLDALHHVMDRSLIPTMVALLVRAGLARPVGTRLAAALDGLNTLQEPPAELWNRVLCNVFTVRVFAAVMRLLREPGAGFVAEATLRRAIKTLHHTEQVAGGHPFPTDGRGNEAGARAELDALRASPLVEPGRTPDGVAALRLHPTITEALRGTDTGSPDHRADGHVGVDHEVHAGPSTPPHVLAALGFFCQPKMLDTVSRFTLVPEAVANGAARGLEPLHMEQVLEALGQRGVPDNVRRTLHDYGVTRGRAMFGRGLVVVFGGTDQADRALADTEMASLLGEPLAPNVYLVDSAREAAARARLKDLGMAVGEDTLMYVPPAASLETDHDEGDAPLGTRLQQARRASLAQSLRLAAQEPMVSESPVSSAVLVALAGVPPAAARQGGGGGEVIPLRARKTAAPADKGASSTLDMLERARLEKRALRLRYEPEAGGGTETMTVEVVETFTRAGAAMVRVKFPRNPRAAERVLRAARIQVAEPLAAGAEGEG